jgi:dTMP kinase
MEPSSGVLGSAMRDAIEGREEMTPEALALGFAADRIHHIKRPGGIQSMLGDGVWVISDRYVLSSLAYQAAQGVDMDWLVEINRFAPTPDVTVFIDTPLKVCLERITSRGSNLEDVFHKRARLIATRRQYLHALARGEHLGKLVTVDGSPAPDEVVKHVLSGMIGELRSDFGLLAESHLGKA